MATTAPEAAKAPQESAVRRIAEWLREPVAAPKPGRIVEWLREPVGGGKPDVVAATATAERAETREQKDAASVAEFIYADAQKPKTRTDEAPTRGTNTSPVVRTTEIERRYTLGRDNEVAALRGASIEIGRGEMVAIVGPSGSGKSTLMHIVGCLDTPDSGEVEINGRRVDNLSNKALTKVRSAEIGFIFQGFNLIPTLNAMDNVALAAEYAGVPRGEALKRADGLLELVGLGERKMHSPSELSGGQQQRVAIARALVNRPALVLGDEPTGDLDTATSDEIVGVMRKINTETGTTFVLVTHNPEVAEACDRTIKMRDGSVEDHGFENPTGATADAAASRPTEQAPGVDDLDREFDETFAPAPAPAYC